MKRQTAITHRRGLYLPEQFEMPTLTELIISSEAQAHAYSKNLRLDAISSNRVGIYELYSYSKKPLVSFHKIDDNFFLDVNYTWCFIPHLTYAEDALIKVIDSLATYYKRASSTTEKEYNRFATITKVTESYAEKRGLMVFDHSNPDANNREIAIYSDENSEPDLWYFVSDLEFNLKSIYTDFDAPATLKNQKELRELIDSFSKYLIKNKSN